MKAKAVTKRANITQREADRAVAAYLKSSIPKRVFKAPQGECTFCDEMKEGGFFPPHDASAACRSGGHNHCTCDTCF